MYSMPNSIRVTFWFNISMMNRIHHQSSLETEKSQPEGEVFERETRLCRVSHLNSEPEGWDSLSSMKNNDWSLFLRYQYKIFMTMLCHFSTLFRCKEAPAAKFSEKPRNSGTECSFGSNYEATPPTTYVFMEK